MSDVSLRVAEDGADVVVVFVLIHALARICSLVIVHFHSHCRLHPHSAAGCLLSVFITLNLVTCSHSCSIAKLLRINLDHWFLSHVDDLAGDVSESSFLYLGTAIRPQQVGKTGIVTNLHRFLERSFGRGPKSQSWHLMSSRGLHTVVPLVLQLHRDG